MHKREAVYYTCDYCGTDYSTEAGALGCEANHKKLDTAEIDPVYKQKVQYPSGEPTRIRVRFKGESKWVEYLHE